MENFIFSLNATMPVFLVIVAGWFLMQLKLFNREFLAVADKYVFKVALPVLLFRDIATTDLREGFQLKFVLFCMAATTVMFLGIWGLASLLMKDKSMVGAFTQAAARGSAAVLGIVFNAISVERFKKFSMIAYIATGWAVVLAIVPLVRSIPLPGIILMVIGGLMYTIGIVFYKMKKIRYMHSVWHLFVLAGALFQYFAILFYVIL